MSRGTIGVELLPGASVSVWRLSGGRGGSILARGRGAGRVIHVAGVRDGRGRRGRDEATLR